MAEVQEAPTAFVETHDGRTLAYEQAGDRAGYPVFVLHGTPGSRFSGQHPDPDRVRDAGLWVVTYDRPGYGQSTRQAGRTVVDCVADVAAIADELGIDRFAVTGGSGGGPHALAVAACLPERVIRAEANVSPAPYQADGLDYFHGMDRANIREFGWALEGEKTLSPELEREAGEALAKLDEDPAALLSEFELSEADEAVLQQDVVRMQMRTSFREAVANGVWGWVDDDLAFIKPWGFEVTQIRVPVQIRYGVGDVLVPAAHGEWLAARVPGASVIAAEAAGHLSTPDEHLARLKEFVAS